MWSSWPKGSRDAMGRKQDARAMRRRGALAWTDPRKGGCLLWLRDHPNRGKDLRRPEDLPRFTIFSLSKIDPGGRGHERSPNRSTATDEGVENLQSFQHLGSFPRLFHRKPQDMGSRRSSSGRRRFASGCASAQGPRPMKPCRPHTSRASRCGHMGPPLSTRRSCDASCNRSWAEAIVRL